MTMKIFLSHASENKALVRRISTLLPAHVDVWLDKNELATGVRFGDHIEDAIDGECDYLIVFVDAHALASDWVRREVELGLRREADLKRTFVLPVLLQPVGDEIGKLGPLADRLYLEAFDHSDDGIRTTAQQLAEQLFALASRLIETLRDQSRRRLLRDFAADVTALKQVAFLWIAALANPLAVLSSNQEAFDTVARAVADYNRVADDVIPRLNLHRDRITDAWERYRGLCADFRAHLEFIEKEVYRGALFAPNEVHAMINRLAREPLTPPAALQDMEQRNEALLHTAREALDKVSRESTQFVASLEREI